MNKQEAKQPTKNRGKPRRFTRQGTLAGKPCPWCYQADVAYKATKPGVLLWCPKQCGYRVWMMKTQLDHLEKKAMYGAKKSTRKSSAYKRKPSKMSAPIGGQKPFSENRSLTTEYAGNPRVSRQ